MSTSVAALRALIEQKFPDAAPLTHRTTEQVATGIAALDRLLPSGGLPRGRLSVWAPRGGATALLRSTCLAVVERGERSAWIDGDSVVAGAFWEHGPHLVRPTSRLHTMRAAEELLRCGGFALVVLTGADARGPELVRLTRAAREGGTAFVALTSHAAMSSLRLTSRLVRYQWKRTPFGEPAVAEEATVRVAARAPGWNTQGEFPLEVCQDELRLSLESALADRRGLPR